VTDAVARGVRERVGMDINNLPAPAEGSSSRSSWRSGTLTPPIDRGAEVRCYMRDPDGYLIEVGQSTGLLGRR
jgi:hypothetical protein